MDITKNKTRKNQYLVERAGSIPECHLLQQLVCMFSAGLMPCKRIRLAGYYIANSTTIF